MSVKPLQSTDDNGDFSSEREHLAPSAEETAVSISGGQNSSENLNAIVERLERIEATLKQLVDQRTTKEWYTPAEAAQRLGKAEFTVREWCRLGRIHAEKRRCGRGRSQEWMIAQAELERIQNEGLLPQPTISTRIR